MKSLIKNLKTKKEGLNKNQAKEKNQEKESQQLKESALCLRPGEKPAKRNKSKRSAGSLSIEQLKKFPGLEALSDEKAREVITSLEAFAQLTFNQYTSLYGQP